MKANASKVAEIIERYPSENRMNRHLKECAAVAFYRVYRLGCIVTARHGSGVLIAKIPGVADDANKVQKWSAPAAVSVSGIALAGAIGFEYTDFVMFLDEQSLTAFYDGNALGASTNLCFAFGPYGSAAEAGGHTGSDSAMKMIGRSTGLFAGGTLEFSSLMFDRSSNRAQYPVEHVSAKEILTGAVAFPEDISEFTQMVTALNRRLARELPAENAAAATTQEAAVPAEAAAVPAAAVPAAAVPAAAVPAATPAAEATETPAKADDALEESEVAVDGGTEMAVADDDATSKHNMPSVSYTEPAAVAAKEAPAAVAA